MALKIIGFIFVISLVFGNTLPNQLKDVPFDVNEVINQVSPHDFPTPNPCPLIPELTGEFLIDTFISYVPAIGNQTLPAIAFNGTNYLVVWHDDRSGMDIFGARVNQSGILLDSFNIPISTATNWQKYPSVAFDGVNYLVVWEDRRNDLYSDIYGARVSPTGIVLDPNGIPISTAANKQGNPSVAFDGTNYLVVWMDLRSGYEYIIYGARVNPSGTVLDPNGFAISTDAYSQGPPSIAFDGINYLVVWQDMRNNIDTFNIYGSRVNQSGTVLDPNGIAISTATNHQLIPSVVFNGTDYFVVWEDLRSSYESDIYGARVSPAGIVLDTNGIPISTAINDQRSPSVSFDGTNYFMVWEDGRDDPRNSNIYGSRVNQSGTVLDPNGIAIISATNQQRSPSLTFDGINYLVVWGDRRNGLNESDIYIGRVSQSGVVLDTNGISITSAANQQELPSLCFDGINYFVVWEDHRTDIFSDIYGARISQQGSVLDSQCVAISTAIYDQQTPSIAFDGSNYLVVWQDYRSGSNFDIYGARVNPAGVVLDPEGIAISTEASHKYSPSVAFDGTNYLVVWEDFHPWIYSIYGARVNQQGIVLDPNGFIISTSRLGCGFPTVNFDSMNYLVVWEDYRNGEFDVYGARVDKYGTVLDPNGILISNATNYQEHPRVVFDGINFLVVWQDSRINYDEFDIYGARMTPAGIVLDSNGILISAARYNQYSPSITFDGTNYLVIWTDERNAYGSDIYGAKVNRLGIVIDSFSVITQIGSQFSPALVCGFDQQGLISYSGWAGMVQNKTYNSMRIWGKFYPFINIEEENSKVKMQSAKLYEIYPNPSTDVLRVRGPLNEKTIKIFDICGKMIKEIATTSARNDEAVVISLKGINPGIYFLRLGKETKKFIVAR